MEDEGLNIQRDWSLLLSESEQIYLLPVTMFLTDFFSMRYQEPELRYFLKPGTMGFGQLQDPVGYNQVTKHNTEFLPHGFESQTQVNDFKHNFQKWKDDDLTNTL